MTGSTVTILTSEPEGEAYLSSEEEEALLEAMAEADRGETISAEELFARLDRLDGPGEAPLAGAGT